MLRGHSQGCTRESLRRSFGLLRRSVLSCRRLFANVEEQYRENVGKFSSQIDILSVYLYPLDVGH